METLGSLNRTCVEHTVEWLIPNFISLSAEDSKCYNSPPFSFCSVELYLRIYPNGDKKDNSIGYLGLFLFKKSGPDINLEFSLNLKNSLGTGEEELKKYTHDYKKNYGFGSSDFISRSDLLRRKSKLLPANALTVTCAIKCKESEEHVGNYRSGNCLICEESLESEFISFHKKCIDRPMKCQDCAHVVLMQDWLKGHECEKKKDEDVGSFSEDFKNMIEGGINHDLILKSGDTEFRAHKDVLRARSQVFKSMLEYDMKEKNSGIINVPDCDPQALEVFLSYVYSGKVDALQDTNMLQLYYIADKYQMNGLKSKCCNFIKQSLSVTNISDAIQLALNHSNSGLFDFATEYFNNNALDIFQTVEWQNFMKDKSALAKDLLIKSYKNILTSKDRSGICFSCKESLETDFISFHKKCIDRPMNCPDCADVVLIQDWLKDHECEKERDEDDGSLSEDFQKMLEDGSNHDLILKIGDIEIRAHKDVLRARSQVFKSMLEHGLKEKNSGIIDVPDCDPQAMEVFLSYVYSGKVESLQENNMLQLYYIADKYEMTDLKNKCCNFIKRSLSFTNFCDAIQLALNHSDTGLFDFAAEYFNNNVLDILKTVEWQNFMKDNLTVANELFIKSHQNKK